ncbi:single-stranded DNA-binding protein [Cysteiniphilum sp. JM-1]|uniref:single-stranded DNA-binding protein n=1 Tax=Cysteiniphilum sp. JM-1 TaxID=2610891 RepID=UPI001248914D|nr:single-stranded DNA-binding protein [Cysteiniphilum sp. JM-1]
MAKGTVNKVVLIGRLGGNPEVRYMPNGIAVANISLATNDGYKDKQTGQYIDVTEWHRVVIFGKQAEVVQQFTQKGSLLYVEGRIRTNKWTDQNGQDRYTTEIVASDIQLMASNNGQGANTPPLESYEQNNIVRPSNQPINPTTSQTTTQPSMANNEYAKAKGDRPSNGNHQWQQQTQGTQKAEIDSDEVPF